MYYSLNVHLIERIKFKKALFIRLIIFKEFITFYMLKNIKIQLGMFIYSCNLSLGMQAGDNELDPRTERSEHSLPADSHRTLVSESEFEKNQQHLLLGKYFNLLGDFNPFVSSPSLHYEGLNFSKTQNNINCKNNKKS